MKNKVIVILGPTATHKSEVAVYLARKFPIEIVSADSMQFYKGMDIGTDKVSKGIRQEVPHHFIDIITVQEEFSIADFKKLAIKTIEEIVSRAYFPLIAGGSGLYIRALTENFPVETSAPPDKNLREKLSNMPIYELRKLANEIDPVATEKVGKGDRKRLIRVIEYFKITGRKISEVLNDEAPFNFLKIGLVQERDALYNSINLRVDRMFEEGFVKEVAILKKNYENWSKTALQAIGYKDVIMYLDGEIPLDKAIFIIKQKTRNFAKRQITWFKKENDVVWFNTENLNDVLPAIEERVKEFVYGD
ncbi:MAG: tRNA (adenosine(37)-N6)-dimethylallyltransferase MiaA [Caldiserica bacterium]|nr:tRNA (adenosine(37)-N6)-dimethylallyltransferase MiaA [Caldisericota bacterium]